MEEIPLWYSLAVFFVLGACVGSFYNVIVYRMPRGISLINPPSHCPLCKKHIPLYYNLPIVGWLILRGKSACCKQPISIIYPIGESLCGLLGALALYAATGFTTDFTAPVQSLEVWADALALFWLLLGIYPVSAVDFKYKLIPDSISVGGIVAGLVISFIPGGMTPVQSIVGAVVAGGGLYLLGWVATKVLNKAAMGSKSWWWHRFSASWSWCRMQRLLKNAPRKRLLKVRLRKIRTPPPKKTKALARFLLARSLLWPPRSCTCGATP